MHLVFVPGPVPAGVHLAGLISPFTVLDGVRQWLGGTTPGIIADPGSYGPAYGLMLLVFLGGSHRRPHRQVPEGRHRMSTIELRNVSRWYGNVVAINDISMSVGPGVTGLLGPERRGEVHAAAHDRGLPAAVAR